MSRSGSITGEIWFQVGEISFPEPLWSDFTIVVLEWWINAIRELEHARSEVSKKLIFMDGPFYNHAPRSGHI